MSGGTWNYRQYHIEELAFMFAPESEIRVLLNTVAQAEHICDWAESFDTSRSDAESKLYDLWVAAFNVLYDR